MKKSFAMILALAMMLSLFFVFSAGAYAEAYAASVHDDADGCFNEVIYTAQGDEISVEGYYNKPSWVEVNVKISISGDPMMCIEGKAEANGTYRFNIYFIETYMGREFEQTINVTLTVTTVSPKDRTAPSLSKTFYTGSNVNMKFESLSSGAGISDGSYTGKLPDGMSLSWSESYATLSGTPSKAGTYNFTLKAYDKYAACNVTQDVSIEVIENEAPKELKITKSPSGETRTEGENALFISAAENYSDVEWRIVTKDGSQCWRNKGEIESKFSGVKVSTYKDNDGRECLYLTNIPLSMDGYYIQTKFWSTDKSKCELTEEKSCLLTVKKAVLKEPSISVQPQGAELDSGKTVTLSVTASSPDGNTLKYQWYKNNNNSTTGGELISGATSSMFTPAEIEGTTYYYCAITNTKGSDTSAAVFSNAAAVKYNPKPVEAPASPSPEVTPATETPAAVVTPAPSATTPQPSSTSTSLGKTDRNEKTEKKDRTGLILAAVILVAAMACATVIIVVKNRAPAAPSDNYGGLHDGVNDEEDYRKYLERKNKENNNK